MRILGLDLSTASKPNDSRTGWAVLADDLLVSAGHYPVDLRGWMRLTPHERCVSTASEVLRVIQAYAPSWVYAEAPWAGKFANATLALGRLQGAVLFAASLSGRQVNFMQPKEWRATIGANAHRGKANAIALIQGWLATRGLPWAQYSEDEMEAIGVAMAAAEEIRKAGL